MLYHAGDSPHTHNIQINKVIGENENIYFFILQEKLNGHFGQTDISREQIYSKKSWKGRRLGLPEKFKTQKFMWNFSVFTCWLKKSLTVVPAKQWSTWVLSLPDGVLCVVWLNNLDEASLIGVSMCGGQTPHLYMGQWHCMALSLACVRKWDDRWRQRLQEADKCCLSGGQMPDDQRFTPGFASRGVLE